MRRMYAVHVYTSPNDVRAVNSKSNHIRFGRPEVDSIDSDAVEHVSTPSFGRVIFTLLHL